MIDTLQLIRKALLAGQAIRERRTRFLRFPDEELEKSYLSFHVNRFRFTSWLAMVLVACFFAMTGIVLLVSDGLKHLTRTEQGNHEEFLSGSMLALSLGVARVAFAPIILIFAFILVCFARRSWKFYLIPALVVQVIGTLLIFSGEFADVGFLRSHPDYRVFVGDEMVVTFVMVVIIVRVPFHIQLVIIPVTLFFFCLGAVLLATVGVADEQLFQRASLISSLLLLICLSAGVLLLLYSLDSSSRSEFTAALAIESDVTLSSSLLRNMMPSTVIDRIISADEASRQKEEETMDGGRQLAVTKKQESQPLIMDKLDSCAILFAEFMDYQRLASELPTTADLVRVIHVLFSVYDRLVDLHGCYKIESIGSVYMIAAANEGLPNAYPTYALRLANLALDMLAATETVDLQAVLSAEAAERVSSVSLRIGIHHGPVISGVIGSKLYGGSFKLIGDSVNVASRMMTNSRPNQVTISDPFRQVLQATAQQLHALRHAVIFEDERHLSISNLLPEAAQARLLQLKEGIRTASCSLTKERIKEAASTGLSSALNKMRSKKASKRREKKKMSANTTSTSANSVDPLPLPARKPSRRGRSLIVVEDRGLVKVKGKGQMNLFFLESVDPLLRGYLEADAFNEVELSFKTRIKSKLAEKLGKTGSQIRRLSSSTGSLSSVIDPAGSDADADNVDKQVDDALNRKKSVEETIAHLSKQKSPIDPAFSEVRDFSHLSGIGGGSSTRSPSAPLCCSSSSSSSSSSGASGPIWRDLVRLGQPYREFIVPRLLNYIRGSLILLIIYHLNVFLLISRTRFAQNISDWSLDFRLNDDPQAGLLFNLIGATVIMYSLIVFALTFLKRRRFTRYSYIPFTLLHLAWGSVIVSLEYLQLGWTLNSGILITALLHTMNPFFVGPVVVTVIIFICWLTVVINQERSFPVPEVLIFGAILGAGIYTGLLFVRDSRHRFTLHQRMQAQQKKSSRLLRRCLPEHVIDNLKSSQRPLGSVNCDAIMLTDYDEFSDVTLLFTDLVGFTAAASRLSSTELVTLLNAMYTGFDELSERYQIFKVEVVGDAYLGVAGLTKESSETASSAAGGGGRRSRRLISTPSSRVKSGSVYDGAIDERGDDDDATLEDSRLEAEELTIIESVDLEDIETDADRVCAMALAMQQHVNSLHLPNSNEPLLMRVGIHSGSVIGAIVGEARFRYHVFGQDFLIGNEFEAHGKAGRILISGAVKQRLSIASRTRRFRLAKATSVQSKVTGGPIEAWWLEEAQRSSRHGLHRQLSARRHPHHQQQEQGHHGHFQQLGPASLVREPSKRLAHHRSSRTRRQHASHIDQKKLPLF